MILVVGGIAAGKVSYARSLGYRPADCSQDVHDACAVLVDAHELVRDSDVDVAALAEQVSACKEVVCCQEVGAGIVPVDKAERAWRDRVGELTKRLAEQASAVVRMTCGIPQAIKGTLPHDHVEVVIMRHGATTANERREYAGASDVSLTEQGEREARAAGVCPQVKTVYVSPLSRARRTAELCFPEARHVVVDDLREMDFGAFEGRSAADMEDDPRYRAWVDGMCEGRCPDGEIRSELIERVVAALEDIVRTALRQGDERVIVVGHGGTIMAALDACTRTQCDYFAWQVGNCEGYRMNARFEGGRLVLEDEQKFGDLSFLQEGHPAASASFFTNRACAYFPCHQGIAEEDFNCLFCYCPLYALGPDCGGNFTYTASGKKNCKDCAVPHVRENGAALVAKRYGDLAALAGKPAPR